MASGKGAASTKWATFEFLWGLGLCGVPSISAVPEAGNPANPKGPWKWFPQKEQTLQNRQLLGFCGVPSLHIRRGLGNGFRERSGLYKIESFWAFVRIPRSRKSRKSEGALETQFPPFRRSQKPEIQQIQPGPWKWLPQKEQAVQNRQL